MIRYSDMMENISVNLSAQSGTVYLSPMLMQFWEPIWNGLSVYKEDGGVNGLILQGSVEAINFALQSIQYYGYFYGSYSPITKTCIILSYPVISVTLLFNFLEPEMRTSVAMIQFGSLRGIGME